MVDANKFNAANLPEPPLDTPPEEIVLTDLVDTDDYDPMGEGMLDSDAGILQRLSQKRSWHSRSGVTGGDLDDDSYQAEVVGEEAVGGENPTPDQNVTEDLMRSMGIDAAEGESVRTQEKLQQRDRQRWELDPASSEDYQDRD